MKYFLYVGLLLHVYCLQGSWIIVQIDNRSDLTLMQAVRNHNVEIDSISQIFKNAPDKNSINIPKEALFGTSGGCEIIVKAPDSTQFEILFLSDLTHRVANGRSFSADLDSRNAAAFIKQPMMARVFEKKVDGTMKLLGFAPFDDENQQFRLTLTGSQGNYQAQLAIVKQ